MLFNWKNPIRYSVVVCFECILLTYCCLIAATTVSIGIASYLYETSLTEDSKNVLHSIDENSKKKNDRQNLYTKFIEFVDVHSTTKQLSSIHSILLI